jgi:protein subunit release factor A
MKVIFEIHSAEGGEDSKLLVKDFAIAYQKMFSRFG